MKDLSYQKQQKLRRKQLSGCKIEHESKYKKAKKQYLSEVKHPNCRNYWSLQNLFETPLVKQMGSTQICLTIGVCTLSIEYIVTYSDKIVSEANNENIQTSAGWYSIKTVPENRTSPEWFNQISGAKSLIQHSWENIKWRLPNEPVWVLRTFLHYDDNIYDRLEHRNGCDHVTWH